jgi:hypothetical protein
MAGQSDDMMKGCGPKAVMEGDTEGKHPDPDRNVRKEGRYRQVTSGDRVC